MGRKWESAKHGFSRGGIISNLSEGARWRKTQLPTPPNTNPFTPLIHNTLTTLRTHRQTHRPTKKNNYPNQKNNGPPHPAPKVYSSSKGCGLLKPLFPTPSKLLVLNGTEIKNLCKILYEFCGTENSLNFLVL